MQILDNVLEPLSYFVDRQNVSLLHLGLASFLLNPPKQRHDTLVPATEEYSLCIGVCIGVFTGPNVIVRTKQIASSGDECLDMCTTGAV